MSILDLFSKPTKKSADSIPPGLGEKVKTPNQNKPDPRESVATPLALDRYVGLKMYKEMYDLTDGEPCHTCAGYHLSVAYSELFIAHLLIVDKVQFMPRFVCERTRMPAMKGADIRRAVAALEMSAQLEANHAIFSRIQPMVNSALESQALSGSMETVFADVETLLANNMPRPRHLTDRLAQVVQRWVESYDRVRALHLELHDLVAIETNTPRSLRWGDRASAAAEGLLRETDVTTTLNKVQAFVREGHEMIIFATTFKP